MGRLWWFASLYCKMIVGGLYIIKRKFKCFLFVKYVFYFTGEVDNINILLMLSPLMNYKYCPLHSWNKTYLTKTFEYPLCMTEEKQIYILVWLRKSRYTYLYDWVKQIYICRWMRQSGIHTCMTEDEHVHIFVWLRKSKYTHVYDWEKQLYLLLRLIKADIHTCMTQEKQIYLLVWLRKSRYT